MQILTTVFRDLKFHRQSKLALQSQILAPMFAESADFYYKGRAKVMPRVDVLESVRTFTGSWTVNVTQKGLGEFKESRSSVCPASVAEQGLLNPSG